MSPKGVYERTPEWYEAVRRGNAAKDLGGAKNPNWRGGKVAHPLYDIYNDMIGRCTRPSHPRYSDYGARGIQVCDSWRADFWSFVSDMGERPEGVGPTGRARFSLDRIDNDGNYEPGNVRWADHFEQARNRRPQASRERGGGTGRFVRGF